MTGIASPTTEGREDTQGTGGPAAWSGAAAGAWLAELARGGVLPSGRALVPSAEMAEEAAALATAGYRVQVVDTSRDTLARARKTARAAKAEIETIHGDFFRLRAPLYGTVDVVADRALFSSLEPIRRADWAHLVARILPREGKLAALFQVALNAPGLQPPYAITEGKIRGLLGRNFVVEQLAPAGTSAPGAVRVWRGVFRRK
jgi:SAM-dependent methyltransferase